MASPETTAPAADAPDTRECSKCAETKVVSPETWPYRKGRTGRYGAYGTICSACEAKRKADYEARRDKIKALVAEVPTEDTAATKKAARLDVAKALKAGGRVLNEFAPNVLARLCQYADDPDHPMHQWAMDKLVDRVLPRKLYEELGGQAAGVGSLHDKRPQFVIQVLPAQSSEPEGRVIDVTPTPIPVLPSTTVTE